MDENDLLNQRLSEEPIDRAVWGDHTLSKDDQCIPEIVAKSKNNVGFVQWSKEPNDVFRPSGARCEILETGVYQIDSDNYGIFFQKVKIVTDDLIELDDAVNKRVLTSMKTFWSRKAAYSKRKIIYKRGILLWGPAGSGKTATIQLLINELLRADGLVLLCRHPGLTSDAISILRRIEPDRNIIVVLEDIDEIIAVHGEHQLLALLDGENQVENVVNVATTNYPERLGARIVNRPSRFDERIFVDMPNAVARRRYLKHALRDEKISEVEIDIWVNRTKDFSVAHLRELVVAVYCLDQPFEEVLSRLSKMQFQVKPQVEFKRDPSGFAGLACSTSPPMMPGNGN